MSCKTIPLELILATSDTKLFDPALQKWKWAGTLYWTVQCLDNKQSSVADIVAPKYDSSKYAAISENPSRWDFCNSKGCQANSQSLHIVFTFKPNSTNPRDFLQYTVDALCKVTDAPEHFIRDADSNPFYIDIADVNKIPRQAYLEVWIVSSHAQSGEMHVPDQISTVQPVEITQPSKLWYIFIALLFLLFIAAAAWLYFNH